MHYKELDQYTSLEFTCYYFFNLNVNEGSNGCQLKQGSEFQRLPTVRPLKFQLKGAQAAVTRQVQMSNPVTTLFHLKLTTSA
jgi:hypothetical protein